MNEVIEGIERADAGASESWKEAALAVVKLVAMRQAELTTDDVWQALNGLQYATRNMSALGPVMLRAKREGIIERTDSFRDSQRYGLIGRANAGKPIRVWRSLVQAVGA